NRDRFSETKQKTREERRHRLPLTEDQRGERDKTANRRHVSGKQRRLSNGKIRSDHSREYAREQHTRIPDLTHTHTSSIRGLGVFANRSKSQTKRRVVKNVPDHS